jgi:hypothetical protein
MAYLQRSRLKEEEMINLSPDDLLVECQSPAGPYWYHPDHPMCQDGQVLWEFPEQEDDGQTNYKNSLKNNY